MSSRSTQDSGENSILPKQVAWIRSLVGELDPAYHNLSGLDGKESACNVGNLGSIPGWGRSPGEGNGSHSNILAWRIPWGHKELDMTERLTLSLHFAATKDFLCPQ